MGNINIRLLQLRWIDGPLHPASILLWDALRGSRYMKTNFCCSNVLLFAANHGARPRIKPQVVLLPYNLPLKQVSENWMANSHLWYLCHWTFVPWQPLYKQRSNIKSHVVLLPHNLALKQVSGKRGELTHLISLHQVTPDSFMHTATWLWRSHETKADDLPKTSSDERQQKRKASCLQRHQLHGTQHLRRAAPYWIQNWKRWTAFNRTHALCSLTTQRMNLSIIRFRINHIRLLFIFLPWLSIHSSLPNQSILHPSRSLTTK